MAPKYCQDAPKTPPRAPKIAQRVPKTPPGSPKRLPRGRLHLRRRGQEAPRASQEAPRGSQERILEPPGRILKPLWIDFGSKFPSNQAAKGLGGCREAQTIRPPTPEARACWTWLCLPVAIHQKGSHRPPRHPPRRPTKPFFFIFFSNSIF